LEEFDALGLSMGFKSFGGDNSGDTIISITGLPWNELTSKVWRMVGIVHLWWF
jgi:hypothetical protein